MNKGFTLAELLIVIVLAGILTLVAMPKYQTAVERTRALEAMENVCMITQYIAIHQLLDANFSIDPNAMEDRLTSKYFSLAAYGSDGVQAIRDSSSGWSYTITSAGCTGDDCERLDLPSMDCGVDDEVSPSSGS